MFDALPPAAQAYIRFLEARVGQLEARLADLEARLDQDSSNSSRPPSSDPPSAKPAPPKAPGGKPRGGQPGHPKRSRPALPPDEVVELRAGACRHCLAPLAGDDPEPLRHQVVEIPPVRPHVTEYRRHRLTCPHCDHVTSVAWPAGVRGGYGERVAAVCGLLTGAYRVGKRGVARLLDDLFGVPISPAMVCKLQHHTAAALAPVHAAVLAHLAGKPANVDETGWRQGKHRGWLWVAVSAAVTTRVGKTSRR